MRLSLLLLPLLLTACGFTPMYGSSGANSDSLNAVAVEGIPERNGQMLRNVLLDRGFGDTPTVNGITLLVTPLVETEYDLGLAPDNTATRRQLAMAGQMTLKKGATILLEHKITANSTYNVLISQYGTVVSQQNAEKQVINDLARQIEMNTALYLNGSTAP